MKELKVKLLESRKFEHGLNITRKTTKHISRNKILKTFWKLETVWFQCPINPPEPGICRRTGLQATPLTPISNCESATPLGPVKETLE